MSEQLIMGEDSEYEDADEEPGCVKRFLSHPTTKKVLFVFSVGYGIFSVVFDWLWVADSLKVEKALVFGPMPEDILIVLILVVSIGTISFIIETTNTIVTNCCDKEYVNEDVTSVITLLVEEVPESTLNLMLVLCREIPMSYWQLIRALLAILGALIRSTKCLVKDITRRRQGTMKKGLSPWILRLVVFLACLYTLIASVLVWTFTYIEPDGSFNTPDSIGGKSYKSDRYFTSAGVYFSLPLYDRCNLTAAGDDLKIGGDNWVKLEGIYDVQDSSGCEVIVHYNYTYSTLRITTTIDKVTKDVCFTTTYPACTTTIGGSCDRPVKGQTIRLKLEHTERTKTRVYGDIKYKALFYDEDESCREINSNEWGVLRDEEAAYGQLQYFQMPDGTNDTYSYLWREGHGLDYYRYEEDMPNVTEAWKTGYKECDMTGALSPNYDPYIPLTCTPELRVRGAMYHASEL